MEPPRRAVSPELLRIGNDLRVAEKAGDALDIRLCHLLLDTVGTKAGDLASDIDVSFVDRVAEVMPGVAAYDEGSGLAHKGAHMADRARHDDGDALHRDPAARAGVAFDDDEPPAPGRGRRLRGVAAHPHRPAHDVLGETGPGMPVDDNLGRRIHAGAIITDMPLDLDMNGCRQPDRYGVGAVRVQYAPMMFIIRRANPVQLLVQLPNRALREVDLDHANSPIGDARNRPSPDAVPR